jgi:thymidylate synthase ThyX
VSVYHQEDFTPDEVRILNRFVTNTDLPVFGLINLPEVVKGALFARYSRSPKSLRRLLIDEFVNESETGIDAIALNLDDDPQVALKRAEELYTRVFFEYGDDSVAQLGGAHLACEQASNLLTKVLEWGRLAAYLEQSTRYIKYDVRLGDRYRYFTPDGIANSNYAQRYSAHMERVFDEYSSMVSAMSSHFEAQHPRADGIRDYNELDLRRVDFVKCMRGAGLPIEVLVEYVALVQQGDGTIEDRKEILKHQREQLAARMEEMQKTLDLLDHKIEVYENALLKKEHEIVQTEELELI